VTERRLALLEARVDELELLTRELAVQLAILRARRRRRGRRVR